jgi:phage repressor protein C with HTH and peptisase S24 domain
MPADVISIGTTRRRACWSLLEVAPSGGRPVPYGILLADRDTDQLTRRLRDAASFDELDEPELDILTALPRDLDQKAGEIGALGLLDSLEDSLSGFFRISDRTSIAYSDAQATVDRLFNEHVDANVRPFITHLPLYGLAAAATKFSEDQELAGEPDAEPESWVRVPENLRLTREMFVTHVAGRSMEPLIPDGSLCIFRAGVGGSRYGKFLLIEKFDENDFAARYTVKKYARRGGLVESAEREGAVRLEPLNREFEAFDLASDQFRVIAEFVQVLPS